MKITNSEKNFLLFFIPLFILKILDFSAESMVLKVISIALIIITGTSLFIKGFSKKEVKVYFPILFFCLVITVFSGKAGIFTTAFFFALLKNISSYKNIYKASLFVGAITLLILISTFGQVQTASRYINGEWSDITKRNNIYFVGYTALVSLYLLSHSKNIKWKHIAGLLVIDIIMYQLIGSRTGLLANIFLLFFVSIFKFHIIIKQKVLLWLCYCVPILCLAFSLYSTIEYETDFRMQILDMYLQGRINLQNLYWHKYPLTILGQKIYEGTQGGWFMNLDNAYMDMVIHEGILFTVAWMWFTLKMIHYYYKSHRMVEVAIILMYATYGIGETFLPNCFLNISLFLYAKYLYNRAHNRILD